MGQGTSIVSLGELSKPATVLIEKISAAIGGVFKPYQIIRVAKAEAEADRVRAQTEIEISDLHRRALQRFLNEEAQKQQNIEDVTSKAIPLLEEGAKPENLENDWIANFFDKSRLTSNEELQQIWARVLAGEANRPGTFARRTVNFLASLDKSDADQFTALCSFCWMIGGVTPLVFDPSNEIYTERGINFSVLSHLAAIGLIQFEPLGGFVRQQLPKRFAVFYYGRSVQLQMPLDANNTLELGHVLLTKMGIELAPICGSSMHAKFFHYVEERWKAAGLIYRPEEGQPSPEEGAPLPAESAQDQST